MSSIDTDEYRQKLEDAKRRLTGNVEFLERENPGTMSDELGELTDGAADNHLGDMATEMYDRELEQGLEQGAQQTIEEIDDALLRIEEGRYGTCEMCGEPIGAQRLAAIPWTRYCIDHA